jgi:hypothetical protein
MRTQSVSAEATYYFVKVRRTARRERGVRALHNSYRGVIPARSKSVNGPRSGHSGYSTS